MHTCIIDMQEHFTSVLLQPAGPRVWGYQAPVPQPGLVHGTRRRAKCGADCLQYSNEELRTLGEYTHQVATALAMGSTDNRTGAPRYRDASRDHA